MQLLDSQTIEGYPESLQKHLTTLPECEFGFEHSLSLQSSALSDEQVVVVSLEWSFVNVEHFIPQVEGHAVPRIMTYKGTEVTGCILSTTTTPSSSG